MTAVTPLAFVVMGETNVEEIAEHCGSLDVSTYIKSLKRSPHRNRKLR